MSLGFIWKFHLMFFEALSKIIPLRRESCQKHFNTVKKLEKHCHGRRLWTLFEGLVVMQGSLKP